MTQPPRRNPSRPPRGGVLGLLLTSPDCSLLGWVSRPTLEPASLLPAAQAVPSLNFSPLLFLRPEKLERRLQKAGKAHIWGSRMSAGNLEPTHTGHVPPSLSVPHEADLGGGVSPIFLKPLLMNRRALRATKWGHLGSYDTDELMLSWSGLQSQPSQGPWPHSWLPALGKPTQSDVVADVSPSPGDTSQKSSPAKANVENSRDKEIYHGQEELGLGLKQGAPPRSGRRWSRKEGLARPTTRESFNRDGQTWDTAGPCTGVVPPPPPPGVAPGRTQEVVLKNTVGPILHFHGKGELGGRGCWSICTWG